jgi:O-antigen/teichoic acid export membrane protein
MATNRTKNVLALSLGQTFAAVASLITGMVASRILTKLDYATLKQTMLTYNFVAPIIMLGLPNALYYFLPRNPQRSKGLLLDNLILLLLMGSMFSLFLSFGGYKLLALRFKNPDLLITLKWLIPYPLFIMPVSIIGAVLLTQNKTTLLVKYNIITSLIITISVICGTLITRSYAGALLPQIYLPLLFMPIAIWLCFKYVPGKYSSPSANAMRQMLKYSVPLGLAGMLSMIMLETNKFVVASMCTPEEFANYINGAIEIPLIGVITGSIASVILVDMTNYIHEGKFDFALDLFKKAAQKSATILFPVMIFLLISGKSFIIILFSSKYVESVIPFYIYLFVLPIRIVMYGSALMAQGKSKTILYRSIIDLLVNTVLSVLFVYIFGYLGAAIATILTLYIWTVPYNLYKIGQGFNVTAIKTLPFKNLFQILSICCIALPLTFLQYFIPNNLYFYKLIFSALTYFPITFVLLYKFDFIDKNVLQLPFVNQLFKNIK